MPPKLDLNLAFKVVQPFDGTVTKLTSFIESVELLRDYAEDVPEVNMIKFLKTVLTGAAHGAIDNSATVAEALQILKQKFAIRVTPKAVQNEMHSIKQNNRSISDFGAEIEKLSAKLAAAHVSMGTFDNEAAAANVVEPIAVQAFVDGLKDPSTKFFLKARNPENLNKAVSDALECHSNPSADTVNDNFMALWCTSSNSVRHSRGYDRRPFRGRHGHNQNPGRNNGRGRGYIPQSQRYQRGYYRGNYRGQPNPRYQNNNYRGRGHPVNLADVAPQQQQQLQQPQQQQQQQQQQQRQQRNPTEEANLIDLFR